MKRFIFRKQADLIGQALMLLPLICLASPETRGYAMLTYFSVGIWQTGSCVLFHAKSAGADRRSYEATLCWLIGIPFITALLIGLCALSGHHLDGMESFLGAMLLLEGLCLLLISPFLAIWYARITMDELAALNGALKHRTEIHWKL